MFIKGVRLLDMGVIEETILPEVKALAQVLYTLQENEKEIDWVFFSRCKHCSRKTDWKISILEKMI